MTAANPHQRAARERKVASLLGVILAHTPAGVSGRALDAWIVQRSRLDWIALADRAGCNPPSAATIALLRERVVAR